MRLEIVRLQLSLPADRPHSRGVGIAAVPGDVIAIYTPDGVVTGEVVCADHRDRGRGGLFPTRRQAAARGGGRGGPTD
jgi:hypothetical protein